MRSRRLAALACVLATALATSATAGVPPPSPPVASPLPPDGSWKQVDAPGPGHRFGVMMAYDAHLRATVLFGGYTLGETLHDDTWLYDGDAWHRVRTAHVPPARTLAAFAYDPALRRTVMSGGLDPHTRPQDLPTNPCGFLGDTWTFDGHDWTPVATGQDPSTCEATPAQAAQADPTGQPIARYGAAMTYDAATRSLVMFGGYGCTRFPGEAATCGYLDDTWRFTYHWVRVTAASHPPARLMGQMATDETGTPTLFGGMASSLHPQLDDTWRWVRGRWVAMHPSVSPAARDGAGVTSWPGHGVVLVGGHGYCADVCASLADAWLWRHGRWQRLPAPPGGQGRYLPGLASDRRGRLMLAVGLLDDGPHRPDAVQSRDSWVFDGGAWRLRPYPWPEASVPLGFWSDPHRRVDVLLDAPWVGASLSHAVRTWVFRRGHWQVDADAGAPTPARQLTTAGFDPVRREAVLYGGANVGYNVDIGWFSDTWVLRGDHWRRIVPAHQPPPGRAVIVYDPVLRALVMQLSPQEPHTAINLDSPAAYNNSQLWRWTGTDWLPLETMLGPSDPRQDAVFAYVPSRRSLVVSGGYRGPAPREDLASIELAGSASIWTPVPGGASPAPAGSAAGITAAGDLLTFGGCASDLVTLAVAGTAGPFTSDAADGLFTTHGACVADTWRLSAAGWQRLSTATAPSPRYGAAMARLDDGRLAMFGGQTLLGQSEDLWTWVPAA